MKFFDWVDFFMNPYNIFIFGFAGGSIALFFSAGTMWLIKANRKVGGRIITIVVILTVLLIQLTCWGLVVWYNTPMDPPLELR